MKTALGNVTCGYLGSGWKSGKLVRGGAFLAASDEVKQLRGLLKRASPAKRAKIEKSLAKAKSLLKTGTPECRVLPRPNILPTPTPSGPKATPTPQANPCRDNLDISGKWGIPAGFRGKVSRGETEWGFRCQGCHGSPFVRQNRSYQDLDYAFDNTPEMAAYRPETQDMVDIVVLLNCIAELNNR